MKRALVLASLLAAHVAAAEPHHILVLRADGNADAATRGKIDTQVLKLAKSVEGNVEAGDISFTDAAAVVGCSPSEPACKDEVLGTLGVDEVVATTVTSSPPGELKVSVRRLAKGASAREATATIPPGQAPDQRMNADVGPMFGLVPPPADKPKPPPPTPAITDTHGVPPAEAAPPATPAPAPAGNTAAPGPTVTAAPDGQVAPQPAETSGAWENRRLELTGMAVGGGLVVLGAIFWGEAASTQSDIDAAMPRSPKDFQNLQDLESTGDSYATLGNICFVGGVAVAAVSTYFYFRDRHSAHAARTAHLAPAVFDHGAGVTLSFGGGR